MWFHLPGIHWFHKRIASSPHPDQQFKYRSEESEWISKSGVEKNNWEGKRADQGEKDWEQYCYMYRAVVQLLTSARVLFEAPEASEWEKILSSLENTGTAGKRLSTKSVELQIC